MKKTEINNYFDEYAKMWAFSGSISAVKDGEVVFENSYGYSNIEHKIDNQSDTRYRIWSITKQFTAAAILLLEERGLLKVEDFINDYFDSEFDSRITIHHLLNHTSGIFNYSDMEKSHEEFQRHEHTQSELLEMFSKKELDFEPGEGWNYSNSGYYVLGMLIERLSGMSYGAFLEENIFAPLNMRGTGVDDGKTLIENKATGYYLDKENLIHCNYINMELMLSSGAMYSTITDLQKWSSGLMNEKVISSASLKKMTTAYKGNYGYGLFINEGQGRVSHGGGCEGFLTELHMYKEKGLSIAILSNYGFTAVYKLCEVLAAMIQGQDCEKLEKPKEIANGLSDEYIGIYEEEDFKLEVIKTEVGYTLIMDNVTHLPSYATAENTLHHSWIDEDYTFEKDDKNEISIWGVAKI